jgi:hypothetical protein
MMMSYEGKISGGNLNRPFSRAISVILFLFFLCPQLHAGSETASQTPVGAFDSESNQDQGANADFRFGAPKGFVAFRIGKFFPQASSDIFDMITSQLTLEKSDFQAWDFGIDGGVSLKKRVDLILSFDYMKRTKDSEFREYVDENNLPITQTTNYAQLPMTAGVKFLPIPRGRQVGQYAWMPRPVVPYISGGVGVLWYRFQQDGDFVDERTLEIFPADLRSSGWAPTAYAGGGAEIKISKSTFLILDLRYSWAKPELQRDFVSFDTIDLSGLRVTAGLQWHF